MNCADEVIKSYGRVAIGFPFTMLCDNCRSAWRIVCDLHDHRYKTLGELRADYPCLKETA